MAKSKLITALKSLTAKELSLTKKHIKSKFGESRPELVKLFSVILQQIEQDQIDKIRTWNKVFKKGTDFNDTKWRTLLMVLNNEIVNLIKQEYLENDGQASLTLIELISYHKRNLPKHFDSSWLKIQSIENKARHTNDFYILCKAYEAKHNKDMETQRKNVSFEHLDKSNYYNELFYITQKFKLICNSYAQQISSSTNFEVSEDFLDHSYELYADDHPIIKLFVAIIKLNRQIDNYSFTYVKSIFFEFYSELHKEENLSFLSLLINYCIDKKINKGDTTFFQELFSLYKFGIDKRILFKGNLLHHMHYKNVITVGLFTKEYEWTEDFIERHTNDLPKTDRDNAYNFNMAKVLFSQKKYRKVIELLHTVEYNNIQYTLSSKLIQLKTYYELQEIQALEALIESLRLLLTRSTKISTEFKKQYLDLLKYLKRLMLLNPYDKDKLNKLYVTLKEKRTIPDKAWIVSKLEEKISK